MKPEVKALLLGVDIQCNDEGRFDTKRKQQFTEALERLAILTDSLRPDALKSMLDSGEEVILWLHEHPMARVTLGYWCVTLESPEFGDVDFERFDWPFGLNGAVEDFSKSQDGDCWGSADIRYCACWSLG